MPKIKVHKIEGTPDRGSTKSRYSCTNVHADCFINFRAYKGQTYRQKEIHFNKYIYRDRCSGGMLLIIWIWKDNADELGRQKWISKNIFFNYQNNFWMSFLKNPENHNVEFLEYNQTLSQIYSNTQILQACIKASVGTVQ